MSTLSREASTSADEAAGRPIFYASLVAIVALAASLRFYNLGGPPVWMDEAFSYLVARQPLHVILFNEVDNHPPLFYAVQHLWLLVLPGLGWFRVPVALAGIATVAVVGLAARDLVSPRAGLLAAGILAVSTGHIYMSQDSRMYTLATLGLTIAAWGLIGWGNEPRPSRRYGLLYLLGAVLAIYTHAVGLFCLATMNLGLLCHLAAGRAPLRRYRDWLFLNLILLIIALPWLAVLGTAASTFPGEAQNSIMILPWMFRNMVGYPALPGGIKHVGNILLLVTVACGTVVGWRTNRRSLVFVASGMLLAYPALLGILNLAVPLLLNRMFLPCAIPAALLAALAIDGVSRKPLLWAWIFVLLGFGASSSILELRQRVKPEDVPQALALSARYGFAAAPIITSNIFVAGTIHVTAPERELYLFRNDRMFRIDSRFDRLYGHPIVEVRRMDGVAFNRALGGAAVVAEVSAHFARTDKILLIHVGTTNLDDRRPLAQMGFEKVAAPPLQAPKGIFENMSTVIELWARHRTQQVEPPAKRVVSGPPR